MFGGRSSFLPSKSSSSCEQALIKLIQQFKKILTDLYSPNGRLDELAQTLDVVHVGSRGQTEHGTDLRPRVWPQARHNEKHSAAHRVADVKDLFPVIFHRSYVINYSWHIVNAYFVIAATIRSR